jgi:hypothetical protein
MGAIARAAKPNLCALPPSYPLVSEPILWATSCLGRRHARLGPGDGRCRRSDFDATGARAILAHGRPRSRSGAWVNSTREIATPIGKRNMKEGVLWQRYDRFNWTRSKQRPMDAVARSDVAHAVSELLELSNQDRRRLWGEASPPGRYAATVIHINPDVSHRFREVARSSRIHQLAVKVFKTTPDAQRQARRLVCFHNSELSRLPGIPNAHVQQSLAAGITDSNLAYIIQEWIHGETLEDLHQSHWRDHPIDGAMVQCVLRDVFVGIIFPLWSVGTIWWDVRDANFCYRDTDKRLVMIDVDSLAAYASEILTTPHLWTRREKGRETAIARLRQLSQRIVLAQRHGTKRSSAGNFRKAWADSLKPELYRLGRNSNTTQYLDSFDRFMEALASPARGSC